MNWKTQDKIGRKYIIFVFNSRDQKERGDWRWGDTSFTEAIYTEDVSFLGFYITIPQWHNLL